MSSITLRTRCFLSTCVGSVSAGVPHLATKQTDGDVACALIASDEETLCSVARWFMKEFQFVTDGYRLYSTLNRVCDSSKSWYNSGPSQKYILRQVKAMDFSLVGEDRRKTLFKDKASYTTKDEKGNQIQAQEMDVALLVLYGHILCAGRSYSYALSKLTMEYCAFLFAWAPKPLTVAT